MNGSQRSGKGRRYVLSLYVLLPPPGDLAFAQACTVLGHTGLVRKSLQSQSVNWLFPDPALHCSNYTLGYLGIFEARVADMPSGCLVSKVIP